MSLNPGVHFGSYEVMSKIGEGGMGEVYRARDTKLNRNVAIKVLPDIVAADPERLARFRREAQILASLNHPHIAQIYGFEESEGVQALVMEFVDGPTLAEILQARDAGLPADEAITISRQIAGALESAHEQGIVHRDLKPANIKIRDDGTVKVLDFGLAKLADPASASSADLTRSPTLSAHATMAGIILGTAAYMSPEQARGKAVDKRADIWAFGVVFYEMLTSRRAFDGADAPSIIGAVIHKEPAWAALPPSIPPSLEMVIRRCLEKDPRDRFRDIGDVRLALDGAFDGAGPRQDSTRDRASKWIWAAGLSVAAAVMMAGGFAFRRVNVPTPAPTLRFAVTPPSSTTLTNTTALLSADGERIIYSVNAGGAPKIYVRALDDLESKPLEGIDNVAIMFLSPDGAWLGFAETATSSLKKVPITGGPAVTICKVETTAIAGASWGADGTIVFDSGARGELWRVAASGGTPELLLKPDPQGGYHMTPEVLPDGRSVLFATSPNLQADDAQIEVMDLRTGVRKPIVKGGSTPRYARSGHLVYAAAGALWAVPFDVNRADTRSQPVRLIGPVLSNRAAAQGQVARYSLSPDGSLVYLAGTIRAAQRTLVWVDRTGHEQPINVPPRAYTYARLSPDGTRVALDIRDQMNDVWVLDLARESLTRLTFDPGINRSPVWSPDGRRLVFSTLQADGENLYSQPADGSSPAQPLTRTVGARYFATAFSADGTQLLIDRTVGPWDMDLLSVDSGRITPLLHTDFNERNADVSPDGQWMAYESNESGRYEVYVRPFPAVASARWQVSSDGGTRPRWSHNGRELFYVAQQGTLKSAPIVVSPSFSAGSPRVVAKGPYVSAQAGRTYDVSLDGTRFLMIKTVPAASGESDDTPQLVVVRNWAEELKRRVPID